MKIHIKTLKKILFFLIPILLGSCNINSSMMLKTPRNFKFSDIPTNQSIEYKIAVDDVVTFQIFSNDGFQSANAGGSYTVDFDGQIKVPIYGRIKITGLTGREAERMLEEKYAEHFVKPFVILSISGKQVYIFTGVGRANIFSLKNNSTTLFEALASMGGIPLDAKARKIKVIRNYMDNPEIYQIDLSKLENIKKTHFILQADDIIVMEPKLILLRAIPTELSPWLSILSTVTLLITLSSRVIK